MAKKGAKTSKGKGPSKPRPKKENAGQCDPLLDELAQLPPQERIASVRPFWESLSQHEREALLTVPLEDLRDYAKRVVARARKAAAAEAAAAGAGDAAAEGEAASLGGGMALSLEPDVCELLEEAVRRSAEKGTWKVWHWPSAGVELYNSESFRRYLETELIAEELRPLLPREEGAAQGAGGKEGGKEGGSAGEGEGAGRNEGGGGSSKGAAVPKAVEKPAEAALRLRMVELLQRVHAANRAAQEEEAVQFRRPVGRAGRGGGGSGTADAAGAGMGAVRDINVELITIMMSALEKEHEFLYHLVLYPLTTYLAELLPEGARDSSRTELFFEDLEKLPPEEVARMCEWLTEKLDSFSSKLKPEAKELLEQEEEEEEPIGDVDLFCLTEDKSALRVHPKWLTHLQERQLGADGQPRKVKPSEDPHRLGLLLEWVFGTIVSTAEKARDGAKRALGSRIPQVEPALEQLEANMRDLAAWEGRARTARELLSEMVASRKEAAELAAKYNLKPQEEKKEGAEGEGGGAPAAPAEPAAALPGSAEPPQQPASGGGEGEGEVPDAVMLSMLRREVLLTRAKLHYLSYQQMMAERMLRSLKAQLRQGEPEFDRLKREVEEVKNHQRGLDGTYRTAAEMERHRAQLADAAIEEQIEVQTAFREQGQRLQRIYDHRRETELAMARREQEMKQLSSWKGTVAQIISQLEDALKLSAPLQQLSEDVDLEAQGPDTDAARALVQAVQSVTQQSTQLAKLRLHFHKDIRRQLYGDDDDVAFFDIIKRQLKEIEKRMEDGRAALQHVENFVVNVACDDPGAAVGAQLVLPLLQERLDAKALEYAAQRAEQAQQEVIRMEAERAEREQQEREKKAKQKQKAKDKLRGEKERERAEREARERAEQQQRQEQELKRQQQEEEERRRRAEELEAKRRAEEELMEKRRQELMADEGSHWRQRMEAERLIAAQAQVELELSQQALASELSDSANEAEHPESFQPGARHQESKRRQGREQAAGQQGGQGHGSGQRRGRGGEAGGAGYEDGGRQHRYANGYAHGAPGFGANGYAHPGERTRAGRPGREGGGPRQDRYPDRPAGPQNRAANSTAGGPSSRGAAAAAPRPRDGSVSSKPATGGAPTTSTEASAATSPAQAQPAAGSASPVPPAQAAQAATQAPGPSDFPPLSPAPTAAQPAAQPAVQQQQQQQQPIAVSQLAPATAESSEPSQILSEAVSAPAAAPVAAAVAAVAPGPAAVAVPAEGGAAAAPLQPPAAAAAAQQPPAAVPATDASAAAAIQQEAAAGAAPAAAAAAAEQLQKAVASPVQPPVQAAAVGPLPVGPLPAVPAVRPPGMVLPPMSHPPHPGAVPAVLGGPGAPVPPGMPPIPIIPGMPPPPFAVFPPMPGAPMPLGPGPIMYFPPHGMAGPQMMGPHGPRPAGGPFVPMPGAVFPMVPIPAMPGMPIPMQQMPGGPGPRHGAGHGRSGGGGTSLRVSAQPFVPATMRGGHTGGSGRRAEQIPPAAREQQQQQQQAPSPSGAATEGGGGPVKAEQQQQQPLAAGPAAAVAPTEVGLESGSPRGPLEQLAPHKSAATLSAASSVGQGSADASAASETSSISSSGVAAAAEQPQQGFCQPPLTSVPSRGGQPPAGPVAPPTTTTPSSSSSSAPQAQAQAQLPTPQPQQRLPPLATQSSGAGANSQGAVAGLPPQQQQASVAAAAPAQVAAVTTVVERPKPVDVESLRLVRGLVNAPGLYNCFVNVVVQCLWALPPFRSALLALPAQELESRGGAAHDVRVMTALWGVFKAMDAPAPVAEGGSGSRPAVSAAPLREALTGLRGGAAKAAQFELSEMHDAAEVLGEMFESMHRAELGAAAVAAGEPTLPHRVRVPASEVAPLLPAAPQAAQQPQQQRPAGAVAGKGGARAAAAEAVYVSDRDPALSTSSGSPGQQAAAPRAPTVWSNGSALAKVKQAPTQQQAAAAASSPHAEGLVVRLFGQEVQMLPPSAPGTGPTNPAAAQLASGSVEVLQYYKFFHHVPAMGLRAAFEAAAKRSGSGSITQQASSQQQQRSFEEMLLAAEAGAHHAGSSGGGKGSAAAQAAPLGRLLHRPQVMVLGLVWESPQMPSEAISSTMQAISTVLDVGKLYIGPTSGPAYDLRCMLCYYRSHYCAFALSEEVGQWLLFDDARVEVVGSWAALVQAVVAAGMQPSVLFYEARQHRQQQQ